MYYGIIHVSSSDRQQDSGCRLVSVSIQTKCPSYSNYRIQQPSNLTEDLKNQTKLLPKILVKLQYNNNRDLSWYIIKLNNLDNPVGMISRDFIYCT